MSLRLRLTLLNGLVLLLTIGVFATVAYAAQQRALQAGLDTSLREEARRFTQIPSQFFERGDRGSGRPRSLLLPNPRGFVVPDVFIQITRDGDTVGLSRNLEDRTLPVSPEMVRRALGGEEWFTDVEVEGEPLRLFVAPVRVGPGGGTPIGMVQVARPLEPTYNSLRALQTTFLGVGAVSVVTSLVIGWLLARAALRPIDRLAGVAHAIGAARDFGRRVPAHGGRRRDEVARLADEFNQMLTQLQSAYEQLEGALAAQRRFVADASHELRTPLTSLRGNVELLTRMAAASSSGFQVSSSELREKAPDPEPATRNPKLEAAPSTVLEEMEQVLADMAAETERVTRLVADLLQLAQADAGQHLTLMPIEVGPLVQDCFRAARFLRDGVELRLGQAVLAPGRDARTPSPLAGEGEGEGEAHPTESATNLHHAQDREGRQPGGGAQAELPLRLQAQPGSPSIWVEGDPDRLKQLLLILLDNALKYTAPGGRVLIDAVPAARNGVDGVDIRVEDTGLGIAPENQERIFERFYRVDSARAPGGAGLGLAIARWIADEHRGAIKVQSMPGRGSTFTVWLPTVKG